jgi:protein involved in plasmid replication-relaxation
MQLTARDREIIQLVHRHRFLRSSRLVTLIPDSSQQLLRRLQLLYHHGFLERPRAQIDYYHQGGSRHIVYGIGNKGAALLQREVGLLFHKIRWGEKNRSVGRIFLEHALLVSNVMVTIELACRERGRIRLLTEDQLPLPAGMSRESQPFRWRANLNSRLKLGVIPDRVFALEFQEDAGTRDLAFFFLEADRGTMPVRRHNLSQTSFYRKLLAYEATWSQSIHLTRFGFHRFRVLTVTTSTERLRSLVEACSQLKSAHGLFLFTDLASLEKPGAIFSQIWQNARHGEPTSILN